MTTIPIVHGVKNGWDPKMPAKHGDLGHRISSTGHCGRLLQAASNLTI
jgi:hypothetical protein